MQIWSMYIRNDITTLAFYGHGSGSTRPGTNLAPESTRPRVNSAGSTRPVYFPYDESGHHIHVPYKKFCRYDLEYAR